MLVNENNKIKYTGGHIEIMVIIEILNLKLIGD